MTEVKFETPDTTIVFDVKISNYGRVGGIECYGGRYYYAPEGEVYDNRLESSGIQVGYDDINKLKDIVEEYYKSNKYFPGKSNSDFDKDNPYGDFWT